MIKVTNNTSQSIDVSINKWGNSGQTTYFTIKSKRSGTWDRADERGFVMSLSLDGTSRPYYVLHNSDIKVSSNGVEDHGRLKQPLT